jgi:hypothetical protein
MLYPAELRALGGIIAIGGGNWVVCVRYSGLHIGEGAEIQATRLQRAEQEEGRTEVRPYI